ILAAVWIVSANRSGDAPGTAPSGASGSTATGATDPSQTDPAQSDPAQSDPASGGSTASDTGNSSQTEEELVAVESFIMCLAGVGVPVAEIFPNGVATPIWEAEQFVVFRDSSGAVATYTAPGVEPLTEASTQFYLSGGEEQDFGEPVLVIDDFDYSIPFRDCLAQAPYDGSIQMPQDGGNAS
ncbi:MAG: hypothetical protein LBD97_08110, partial [Bifidobacteriaceae bacterium]|nr:hypothetical protein [Bifidobacteriaceae bacterium]